MKRFFLVFSLCFTLASCETASSVSDRITNISWPSFSSLNPFDSDAPASDETALQDLQGDNQTSQVIAVVTPDQSALDTELQEMEMLTGTAPRFDKASPEIAEGVEELNIADTIVDSTTNNEDLQPSTSPISETTNTPSLALKPAHKPVIVAQEKIGTKKPTAVAQATPPLSEPKVISTPQKTEPQKPISVDPVYIQKAQPVPPTQTIESPLFTEQDLKLSNQKGCPQIHIMPAARSMTYFDGGEISGSMTAKAAINEIRGGCEVVTGGIEVDLDILMKGTITNKGRFEGNRDQEAFMTFPYFVSVTTPQGLPIDKKIMATAMRFRPSVDFLDHAEKITQFIPIRNVNDAQNYKIIIGFQLTRKQLEYNRAETLLRADNLRVAPDLVGRSRVSIDPLSP